MHCTDFRADDSIRQINTILNRRRPSIRMPAAAGEAVRLPGACRKSRRKLTRGATASPIEAVASEPAPVQRAVRAQTELHWKGMSVTNISFKKNPLHSSARGKKLSCDIDRAQFNRRMAD